VKGRTALVTGASSGLGREFARLFAADGFDVALVARSGGALEEVGQEIETRHGIRAHVVPVDLARASAPGELMVELATRDVRVDALVNAAGFTRFGPFVEADERRVRELLAVNVVALTDLTRLALPGMVERGWGRVVNMSSNAAFQPGPLMAEYYASKAYVLWFSLALSEELRGTGVSVTALCPGPTATGFQSAAAMEDSRLVAGRELPTAAEVAAWGFDAVKRGRPYAVHGVRWRAAAFGMRFVPRTTAARIVKRAQERVER
jgi:hypothetical protein